MGLLQSYACDHIILEHLQSRRGRSRKERNETENGRGGGEPRGWVGDKTLVHLIGILSM